jgi:L-fucose isomerase-like protein
MAGWLLTGCVATNADVDSHDHLYSFDELQQHAAEHLNAARKFDTDGDVAVALAKAEALARLARAFKTLSGRQGDVIGPASMGAAQCYNHNGRPVGPCLDI